MSKAAPQETGLLGTPEPTVLVQILIAARRSGDRPLEAMVRRELEQRHYIKFSFCRKQVVSPGHT